MNTTRIVPAIAALTSLCALPHAVSGAPETGSVASATQTQQLEALRRNWRQAMRQVHAPKKGCFKASYPKTEWEEVRCSEPPQRPFLPAQGPAGQSVGNGLDYSALAASVISSAAGTFDSTSGVTGESDGGSNVFSLQINTQTFTTPACAGASNPGLCQGWQQFVYSVTAGGVFMQYWLIDYNATCPSGWFTFGIDCYRNSTFLAPSPTEPVTNLVLLGMVGEAEAGGLDTAMVEVDGGLFITTEDDSVLHLAPSWRVAEFNIFGDGNATDATFNSGATINVRTTYDDGTLTAPTCITAGYTGETNNLNLIAPCCASASPYTAIVFTESNVPGKTSECSTSQPFGGAVQQQIQRPDTAR